MIATKAKTRSRLLGGRYGHLELLVYIVSYCVVTTSSNCMMLSYPCARILLIRCTRGLVKKLRLIH